MRGTLRNVGLSSPKIVSKGIYNHFQSLNMNLVLI